MWGKQGNEHFVFDSLNAYLCLFFRSHFLDPWDAFSCLLMSLKDVEASTYSVMSFLFRLKSLLNACWAFRNSSCMHSFYSPQPKDAETCIQIHDAAFKQLPIVYDTIGLKGCNFQVWWKVWHPCVGHSLSFIPLKTRIIYRSSCTL